MKTFKDIISEVAQPKGGDEKAFKAKHVIQKINHPAAEDDQFTGGPSVKKDKSKKASYKEGEDEAVYEETDKEDDMCPECGESYDECECDGEEMEEAKMSDADMKQRENIVKGMKKSKADLQARYGDKWKSVMYATATKKAMEAVELDEISQETLRQYHGKAGADLRAKRDKLEKGTLTMKDVKQGQNRVKGLNRAANKMESVELEEISRDLAARAAHGFADKGDRALKNKDSREYKRSERGRKMAVDKATGYAKVNAVPRRVKLPEAVELDEAFKAGEMKLSDGSSVKLTNEDVSALNTLFKELNSANQKKMQERMMKDKKGFAEIVSFAKEAL
jgi:hypothetical protein